MEFLGILQEFNDLLHFFLGFVATGDIGKRHAFPVAGQHAGAALAKGHGTAAGNFELAHQDVVKNQQRITNQGSRADEDIDENVVSGSFVHFSTGHTWSVFTSLPMRSLLYSPSVMCPLGGKIVDFGWFVFV